MKLKFFDFLFIGKGQVTDLTVELLKFSGCYGGAMTGKCPENNDRIFVSYVFVINTVIVTDGSFEP